MVKYSFVVPVYNVQDYLEECVNSILLQKGLFEIILIDDGSTDESPYMCDKYALLYPDIVKVIHKSNGGLSDARNTGVALATGDYILFVDSDDYINDNFLEELEKSDVDLQVDVVFLEAIKVYPDGRKNSLGNGYTKAMFANECKIKVVSSLASLPKFPGSACDKLIRRSLFEKRDLSFELGLLSEDIDWSIRLILAAETFDYFGNEYYYYRQRRSGSITSKIGRKNIESLLSIIEKWTQVADVRTEFQNCVYSFLAYEYCILLANYFYLDVYDRRALRERVLSFHWLIDYIKSSRMIFVKKMYRFLNVLTIGRILNTVLLIREKF